MVYVQNQKVLKNKTSLSTSRNHSTVVGKIWKKKKRIQKASANLSRDCDLS